MAIEENGSTTASLVWERHGQWSDDWEAVGLELTGLQQGYVTGKTINLRCHNKRVRCGFFYTKELMEALHITDITGHLGINSMVIVKYEDQCLSQRWNALYGFGMRCCLKWRTLSRGLAHD